MSAKDIGLGIGYFVGFAFIAAGATIVTMDSNGKVV